MCSQNEITRDIVTILLFLSTTFFARITDILGDYAGFKKKLRSSKKASGKDSPDTAQNEDIFVPSFISVLIQVYKETSQDSLEHEPISDTQIKQKVKRDFRKVVHSMIASVTSRIYRDHNDRTLNSEPEGETEAAAAPMTGARNTAATPHFVGGIPSSSLSSSYRRGRIDLMEATPTERGLVAGAR